MLQNVVSRACKQPSSGYTKYTSHFNAQDSAKGVTRSENITIELFSTILAPSYPSRPRCIPPKSVNRRDVCGFVCDVPIEKLQGGTRQNLNYLGLPLSPLPGTGSPSQSRQSRPRESSPGLPARRRHREGRESTSSPALLGCARSLCGEFWVGQFNVGR